MQNLLHQSFPFLLEGLQGDLNLPRSKAMAVADETICFVTRGAMAASVLTEDEPGHIAPMNSSK
jgi:hypothetical protein